MLGYKLERLVAVKTEFRERTDDGRTLALKLHHGIAGAVVDLYVRNPLHRTQIIFQNIGLVQ